MTETVTFAVPATADISNFNITVNVINQNSRQSSTVTIPVQTLLAPVITSVNPSSGQIGNTITIKGRDFVNNGNNIVEMRNSTGWAATTYNVVDSETLTFQVPGTFNAGGTGITTPAGIYSLMVWVNFNYTNKVQFTVVN